MKKRAYQETKVTPTEWWLNIKQQKNQEAVFNEPTCQEAEGLFLSYVLFLALRHSPKENKRKVSQVSLVSYDYQKTTSATALQKLPLEYGGLVKVLLNKQKRYSFGEHTHLVLTGPLAGTIAQTASYVTLGLVKNQDFSGGVPLYTIRPFIPHDQVSEKISHALDKRVRHYDHSKESATHLRRVQRKFDPHNPTRTLVEWLALAGIPHDKEIILANSQLGYTLLQQLAKK